MLLFSCFAGHAESQIPYKAPVLSVTGSRVKSLFASQLRDVIIVTREELQQYPGESVADILQVIGGVDVQRRGIDGVQTDFGIRGSGFEQVLILLDGVRMNDPQTGHHNGDIPVSILDIDRIEILSGQASALYGSHGFGGVINILTDPGDRTGSIIELRGGSFGTAAVRASQTLQRGRYSGRISLDRQRSDGYRDDTDYDIFNLSHRSRFHFGKLSLDGVVGYQNKDFGANGFYANYPSREETETFWAHVNMNWALDRSWHIEATSFVKRHDDFFILDYQRPEWYQNDHRSWISGGRMRILRQYSQDRALAVELEGLGEWLNSTSLGERHRVRWAVGSEFYFPVSKKLVFDLGVRLDYESQWDLQVNPSVNVRWGAGNDWIFRGTVGRVFRAPTFTELYYQSPANKGNSDLEPEFGWSAEIGILKGFEHGSFETTLFLRNERNKIDWVAESMDDPWQVMNLGRWRVQGLSFKIRWKLNRWCHWRSHYTALRRIDQSEVKMMSKYIFNAPIHDFVLGLDFDGPWRLKQTFIFRLKKREMNDSYQLFDVKFQYPHGRWTWSLELTNLFNTMYWEIPGVMMPGRRLISGCRFTF